MTSSALKAVKRWSGVAWAFMRPIEDAELPEVQRFVLKMIRAFSGITGSLVLVLSLYIVPASEAERGSVAPNDLAFPIVATAVMASIFAYTFTAFGERRPQLAVLFIALGSAGAAGYDGVLSARLGEVSPFVNTMLTVPLSVSTFIPWRPLFSLVVGLACGLAHHASTSVVEGSGSATYSYLFAGLYACCAAVANQVQRHLWRELHQTRNRLVAADRMVTMGQLLEGISEAIHTPIKDTADALAKLPEELSRVEERIGQRNRADPQLTDAVRQVEEQVAEARARAERAAKLLAAVRDHTIGLHETNRALFALRDQVESATLWLSHRAQRGGVRIDVSGVQPELMLEGDPGKLEQILTAAMLVLLEMVPTGAATSLRFTADQSHDGTLITVRIDVPGFASALSELLRAPRPLLSTENAAPGVGLFVARHLAEGSFGGTLRAVDEARETGLTLWCPKGKAQQSSRPSFRPGGGLGTRPPKT